MPYPQFDRFGVRQKPLAERANKIRIERDAVPLDQAPRNLSARAREVIGETAARIREARRQDRPVMLTFGAHAIKNGLGPLLIRLLEEDWVTHLATNGAGVIHDWEFAFQGASGEDVRKNVDRGEFGNWQETGYYLNLAIVVGAFEGQGYGEAVGTFIENEGLTIPSGAELEALIRRSVPNEPERAAAAADLLYCVQRFSLQAGPLVVPHPWKKYSVQAAACRLGVPSTAHPMFGHDIIYNHPLNHGAAIGRAAQRDFLTFAEGVSRLEGGVYLSVGSAVMSPMVFEKSLSMAQNLALQKGGHIEKHYILVADLAESRWDWAKGEPPQDHPDYYLRYNKSFSRMGGTLRTVSADNRDLLLALYQALPRREENSGTDQGPAVPTPPSPATSGPP
jgi:hypothetical protein